MPELEKYEEDHGQFEIIGGVKCLVEKSQKFIDRNDEITQREIARRSDAEIYQLIRARSNRREDIQSVTEAFDAGILNVTKRNRGLEIIENEWQVAKAKFQEAG